MLNFMQHLFSPQDLLDNKPTDRMWLFLVMACLIQQTSNSEECFGRTHLNPEGFMTVPEIIQHWGYPSEEYEVLTEDDYYLQLNRIPHGKHSLQNEGPRPNVLLVHGFLMEGRCWIANLPSNSLGFFLADAGYDVWILNLRGTTWSRRHKEFSIDQQEFWEFSFHEMGIYDVPATINFILQKTEQDSLYYVGHSQGTGIGFIALGLLPYLSDRIKLIIGIAPAYTLEGIRGTFAVLGKIPDRLREQCNCVSVVDLGATAMLPQHLKDIQTFERMVQIGESISECKTIWGTKEFSVFGEKIKSIMVHACSYPLIDYLCLQNIFLAGGYNQKNLNVCRADVYAGINPDYSSVKSMNHWGQVMRSMEFKYYDYGYKNIEVYNMTTPPFYKIEDVTVPVAVWRGGKDIAITARNVEALLPLIPHLVFYKNIPDWQHFDAVLGLDAPQRFYPDVLELMQKYKD